MFRQALPSITRKARAEICKKRFIVIEFVFNREVKRLRNTNMTLFLYHKRGPIFTFRNIYEFIIHDCY